MVSFQEQMHPRIVRTRRKGSGAFSQKGHLVGAERGRPVWGLSRTGDLFSSIILARQFIRRARSSIGSWFELAAAWEGISSLFCRHPDVANSFHVTQHGSNSRYIQVHRARPGSQQLGNVESDYRSQRVVARSGAAAKLPGV